MKIDDLLGRLEGVKRTGSGYTAKCTAHEDRKNSLGIATGEDGRILLNCYAGCRPEDIVAALGLTMRDLMPEQDKKPMNETVYRFKIGQMDIVEHVRIDDPGGKRFIWRRNGHSGLQGLKVRDVPLFRPDENGDENGPVVICEGEKSAIAAGRLGLNAYGTACGASSCPSVNVLRPVCAGEKVILWADNDKPGREHMERVRAALDGIAKYTKIITTGGQKDDAADFNGTKSDFMAMLSTQDKRVSILADSVDPMIASLSRYSNGDFSDRVPTGLRKIDYALRGGMMPGALYLVGAPSGHGKTTLLQGIGSNAARIRGPVLFVSPEMSAEELAEREAVKTSSVSVNQVAPQKDAAHKVAALMKISDAGDAIKRERLPIYIVEDPNVTMSEINEIASGIDGLRLVIVDYAQEIANRNATTARYLAVGEVGKDAIKLGKELHVPVMVASQVNVIKGERGALEYAFRETKDLEHRAHCSMIMEVKRYETPNSLGFYDIEATRIFARKNRSGAIFSVEVDYKPSTFTIKDKQFVPRATGNTDEY